MLESTAINTHIRATKMENNAENNMIALILFHWSKHTDVELCIQAVSFYEFKYTSLSLSISLGVVINVDKKSVTLNAIISHHFIPFL